MIFQLLMCCHCVTTRSTNKPTFLGAADLSQFGRSLPEPLGVGPAAVPADLGVSRVVLARGAGLPGLPAGRDQLRDTRSSVHLLGGRLSPVRPLGVRTAQASCRVEKKKWLTSAMASNNECTERGR